MSDPYRRRMVLETVRARTHERERRRTQKELEKDLQLLEAAERNKVAGKLIQDITELNEEITRMTVGTKLHLGPKRLEKDPELLDRTLAKIEPTYWTRWLAEADMKFIDLVNKVEYPASTVLRVVRGEVASADFTLVVRMAYELGHSGQDVVIEEARIRELKESGSAGEVAYEITPGHEPEIDTIN